MRERRAIRTCRRGTLTMLKISILFMNNIFDGSTFSRAVYTKKRCISAEPAPLYLCDLKTGQGSFAGAPGSITPSKATIDSPSAVPET